MADKNNALAELAKYEARNSLITRCREIAEEGTNNEPK